MSFWKRVLSALVASALLLALVQLPALAADYAIVYNTSALNLRDGPGYMYNVIGEIPRGELVQADGETDGWFYITVLSTGEVGYVDAKYLNFDTSGGGGGGGAPIGPITSFAIVANTSSLNLRDGPGKNYNVIGHAARSEWLGVSSSTNGWYAVEVIKTGETGYVDGSYLKFGASGGSGATTGVVNNPKATSFLNLREYPSLNAPVLGIYYNGATFTVLSTYSGWYEVSIDGMIGYFKSEYVRINGSSGSAGTATVVVSGGASVNLREGPSKEFAVIGRYYDGRTVNVLLKGNRFWKISVGGQTGFMSTDFLSTSGGGGGGTPATKGYAVVSNPNTKGLLNLRQQPTSTAKIIAQYKNGIRFEVIAQGQTWCKVYGTASGNTGYMMTKYLKLYGLPTIPQKTVSNKGSYVNLRTQPSKATGSVLTRVNSGQTVIVLTPGDEWSMVRYGNTTGYMMTYYLK